MDKISIVITVKNEEDSIQALLQSIAEQSHLPNEIVIVDGGSTDATVQIVEKFFAQHPLLNGRILNHVGTISAGRNIGIKAAKFDLIAVTDGGCIADKNWLRELFAALAKHDVAAGFYYPTGNSHLQKCLGVYTSVMRDKVDPSTYLPSSRSIAFHKSAWEAVGGYPEDLQTAEDLVFAKKLREHGLKVVTQMSAIVYWEQKDSFPAAFQQFFRYAQGDGQALYIRKRTPLLFMRIFIALLMVIYALLQRNFNLLFFCFAMYALWAVAKNYRYVPVWQSIFILPLLQLIADIAVPLGMLTGFVKRYV